MCSSKVALTIVFVFAGAQSQGTTLFEQFNDVTTLAGAGWVLTNNSLSVGSTGWFQGTPGVFSSQAGAANAYVAANFNAATLGGNISLWLLTPAVSLSNGDVLSFYTRTEPGGAAFLDNLQVRLSTNGASSNVGATDTSVGDFTTLLTSIGGGTYPQGWTQFSLIVSGLGGPTTGRFGFRYQVTDTSVNGDYIGIDTFALTGSVPEPSTLLLLGAGLTLLGSKRVRAFARS